MTLNKWFLIAVCAAACAGATGCRINPVTGQSELVLVGTGQEVALGHQTHPNVIFMYDGEYYDTDLNRYLGTITMRMHRLSHRPEMPMEFTMLNTSVVNAFATPAHVYATRGFLARLENEAQFAAVMGHELAHVAAGHTAKQLTHNVLTTLALGVTDYALGDSHAASAVLSAGQISVTVLGLSYSREQERQADRVGAYYMALAGWNPRHAISMQNLLTSMDKHKATILDRYLSTHPPPEDRIWEIEAVIREKDLLSGRYIQGDGEYADRWSRRLGRLREVDRAFGPYDRGMKLLSERNYREALSAAREAIDMRPDQAQFHRLEGDALLGLERLDEAEAAYKESLARDPRYVPANIGLGRAYLRQGDHAAAEREFATAAHGWPGSVSAWYGLGEARYRSGRYADAIGPLEKAAQPLPDEPKVHYMLAVCYTETGRPARALESYRRALAAGLSGPDRYEAQRRIQSLQRQIVP